jgi:4-hydroxyacetophenone monooxygenase
MRADTNVSNPDLASAVAEGDIRCLLMVLVQTTGDLKWLEPPYTPKRDVRLIPDAEAGLPQDVQAEIRAEVVALFSQGVPSPAIPDPDDELLLRMMSVCLGERVAPEYVPLMREEMGFSPRHAHWTHLAPNTSLDDYHVLIVGAGVCAIALGVALNQVGAPYTIVEKNADIGGTWYVNRYPGCGVDTPNHSYSYSFSQGYDWTRYFSAREEIHAYLKKVASEQNVLPQIRLNTELLSSRWDEDEKCWLSVLKSPEGLQQFKSRVLVSAIGQLNDPLTAKFAGDEQFRGQIIHSADWPDGIDLEGKRVAVIGTGATAMQLVPSIADTVQSLTIYQRTPQWARPIKGYSEPIPAGARWLLKHVPRYAQWYRFNMFWRYGDGLLPTLRKDPEWPFPDRSVNRSNDRHREELTEFIRSELKDRPDLLEKCIPTYPPYGKRILLDNGWYRTLQKLNVELVTEQIRSFSEAGIVTADGVERSADIIVISTGFKVTEMAARLNIVGREGRDLRDAWAHDDPKAYLGMTVPHFPNFFCMMGPNTGPGHGGSIVFQSEAQSRYIVSSLVTMIEGRLISTEVKPGVFSEYVRRVDAEHEKLIWTHPGMTTYYRNGQGRVFSAMPWRFVDYWRMSHDFKLDEYLSTPERGAK